MKKPLFIVFEGIDGSGKSTLLRSYSKYLSEINVPHITTAEPRGESFGGKLFELVSSHNITDSISLFFLIQASRRERILNVIKPALAAGKTVLCDRWIYSTIAYQWGIDNLNPMAIYSANDLATDKLTPDKVVFLNTPVLECLNRVFKRDGSYGNFTLEQLSRAISFYESLQDSNWVSYKETPDLDRLHLDVFGS